MKTTLQINEKPVEIELTNDQVEAIRKASEKITDRVKTFEDAFQVLGLRDSPFNIDDTIDERAYKKLKVIIRALNEGWVPDYTDENQYKYYPWFSYQSGVGFSYYGYGYDYSNTTVGSRLCCKSRELAEYAAKQFQQEYNEYLNHNN